MDRFVCVHLLEDWWKHKLLSYDRLFEVQTMSMIMNQNITLSLSLKPRTLAFLPLHRHRIIQLGIKIFDLLLIFQSIKRPPWTIRPVLWLVEKEAKGGYFQCTTVYQYECRCPRLSVHGMYLTLNKQKETVSVLKPFLLLSNWPMEWFP